MIPNASGSGLFTPKYPYSLSDFFAEGAKEAPGG